MVNTPSLSVSYEREVVPDCIAVNKVISKSELYENIGDINTCRNDQELNLAKAPAHFI